MKDKSGKEPNNIQEERKEEDDSQYHAETFLDAFEIYRTNPDAFFRHVLPRMENGRDLMRSINAFQRSNEGEPPKKPDSEMTPDHAGPSLEPLSSMLYLEENDPQRQSNNAFLEKLKPIEN